MTVQEIITWVDEKYENEYTDNQKIAELNVIQKDIFLKICKLDNNYKIAEVLTYTNMIMYDLPYDCRADNIFSIKLSETTTIDINTTWKTLNYAALDMDTSNGYYWTKCGANKIAFSIDGQAINQEDLTIRIFYYRLPNTLSDTSNTPDLDSFYHDLLKYRLIQAMASWGNYPDMDIANYWESKYQEFLKDCVDDLVKRQSMAPSKSKIIKHKGW